MPCWEWKLNDGPNSEAKGGETCGVDEAEDEAEPVEEDECELDVDELDVWGVGRGGMVEEAAVDELLLLRLDRPYSGMMSPFLLIVVLHTGQSAWPACSHLCRQAQQ